MKKIALITGASGGIGSAIAKCFANNGYAVALQYRNHMERANQACEAFPNGTPYLCVQCDVTDSDSITRMKNEIHARLGEVSTLVNCAGVAVEQKLLTETTDEEYERIFETNVHGMIRITRAFYDGIRQNEGSIINISSIWGVTGGSCEALYSASKAAVIGFTKALAKELAPSGVHVNCIAPGWIPTEMNAHLSEQDMRAFSDCTPLGRLGTPDEIAEAALYFAKARYVTGQVLCCDGGYCI